MMMMIGALLLFLSLLGFRARNVDPNAALSVMVVGFLICVGGLAFAHDHNRPELTPWFKSLTNKQGGQCCDGTDGVRIEDVDWEFKDGKYRVRMNGQWVDVPEGALVTTPNKAGSAIVWPLISMGQPLGVRCFMPGALT